MALSDLEMRAERARGQLFERYDQLNALWINAEEAISRFHIPQEVWYEYRTELQYSGNPEVGHCLGVVKVEGKWRIHHRTYYHVTSHASDVTPITECDAEIRVTTTEYLPKLLDRIVASAEGFVSRVDEAIETIQAFVDSQEPLDEAA